MFTGIVEETGIVAALTVDESGGRLEIECVRVVEDAEVGASIAVDGCCVTVTRYSPDRFAADLMGPTLRATTLGELVPGSPVNLERPLAVGARLGGHLVQGHVDGVGTVTDRRDQPDALLLDISVPAGLRSQLVPRGSLAVSGVSLTVVAIDDATVTVGLVPHTIHATTLGALVPGSRVNLETDVVAKYVAALVERGQP